MKTTNQVRPIALFGLVLAMALVGCGKKDGTAEVNVQFVNQSLSAQKAEYEAVGPRGLLKAIALQSSHYLGVTPQIYQMKLTSFYIVEDRDPVTQENRGAGAHIWINKNCDSDLHYCGINPEYTNGYTADYFDFARSSAEVNADFNNYKRDSKDAQLGTGTYNYIGMDFTGKVYDFSDTTPNLKFGVEEVHEVRAQNQALFVKLPAPLVIEKGDSITVNLAYSLDNRFYATGDRENNLRPSEVSESDKWSCASSNSVSDCIVEVEFSPTVTKK